jgi:hypothetical protein
MAKARRLTLSAGRREVAGYETLGRVYFAGWGAGAVGRFFFFFFLPRVWARTGNLLSTRLKLSPGLCSPGEPPPLTVEPFGGGR